MKKNNVDAKANCFLVNCKNLAITENGPGEVKLISYPQIGLEDAETLEDLNITMEELEGAFKASASLVETLEKLLRKR